MEVNCACYNHTARSLAQGIEGKKCQRIARWRVTLAGNSIACCDKHKMEMVEYNTRFYGGTYPVERININR